MNISELLRGLLFGSLFLLTSCRLILLPVVGISEPKKEVRYSKIERFIKNNGMSKSSNYILKDSSASLWKSLKIANDETPKKIYNYLQPLQVFVYITIKRNVMNQFKQQMCQIVSPIACRINGWINCAASWAQPLYWLALRIYLAQVFFSSGLTKIRDWNITLALFTDEYHVPLVSPAVAAAMGTTGELVLPILLILGLFGRFGAAGLFVVNAMAVISYPSLPETAVQIHYFWGILLLGLALFGPGKWSIDQLWCKRMRNKA